MSTYGPLSQGSSAQISLALRAWDVEWVRLDEGTMGEAQTGGAAQKRTGLAGTPPSPAATSSVGTWAMILWRPHVGARGWGRALGCQEG